MLASGSSRGSFRALLAIAALTTGFSLNAAVPARGASRPTVIGYYVHDDPWSWNTLSTFGERFAWVITTNFSVADTSGALRGTHDARVMHLARRRGLAVHFRISNITGRGFDARIAHAVLTQQPTRARLLSGILAAVDNHGYDGVNIDLEMVPPADRAALTVFTADLKAALGSRGKSLSIAVPGKTGDDPSDASSGAFDLAALGALADRVIIMAYDEHWDTSAPGPVASLPWVEAVTRYAASVVPSQKLVLGVPLYGYDWPAHGVGEGVSMREAVRRAQRAGVPILWDERAQAPYYWFSGHTVYFENGRSLAAKLAVQARRGLAGIAAWRLGHELPEVWDVVTETTQASPP